MNLRSKLTFLFLGLGLAPLCALGWLAHSRYAEICKEGAGAEMHDLARASMDRIDATLFERYGDVQCFAFHPGARGDRAAIQAAADYFTTAYGCYDLMLVADLDGTIVGTNTVDWQGRPIDTAAFVGRSVKGEEWFEAVRAGSIRAGQSYYANPLPDEWVKSAKAGSGASMIFAAPVFDAEGKVVRVWSNRASMERLVESLLAEQRKAHGSAEAPLETQILTRAGNLLEDSGKQIDASVNLVQLGLNAAALACGGKDGYTIEVHKRTGDEQVNGHAASRGMGAYPGNGWGLLMRKSTIAVRNDAQAFGGFLLLVVVASAVLLIGAGLFIARRIAQPLAESARVMAELAQGDFTQELRVRSKDEVGQMAESMNRATRDISQALAQVRTASLQLVAASTQVSQTTTQMSDGSQQQASALEETAASLEEITGTVKQNADSARQANQLAIASRDVAEKGGKVVAEAVLSIREISKSSEKIANIITTIDEIAFQTNLLALNAAVEAARAGEQGRGFAVVASEVRNLAQRSASSAKEIKALIEESLNKVQAGSELVNRSGQSLDEIMTSVKRVTDIIAEIAAASQEQATGVDQVNRAVTQMDQVVQQNAGQASELAGTAQSLSAQARDLQTLVAHFKLSADDTNAGMAPASTMSAPAPSAPRPARATRPTPRAAANEPVAVASNASDDGFIEF